MNRQRYAVHGPFLLILIAVSAFRLWLMTTLELNEDEAYYWEWSRNLDWSYYDQGPGVALATAIGTTLFGHNAWGVRFVAFLLGCATLCGAYHLVWRLERSRTCALMATLLFACAPLNFITSLLMLHDSIMYFAWVTFVCAFCRHLESSDPRWLYACGIALGLGMLAKHSMILIVPPVFLLATIHPSVRPLLRNSHFWGAACLAGALALPMALWNMRHDWAGLNAILHLPSADAHGRPFYQTMAEFVGGQLLVLNPLIAISALAVAWRQLQAPKREPRTLFLALSTTFMLGFFLIMSVGNTVQPNWPICGYFGALLLLGIKLGRGWESGRRRLAAACLLSSVLLLTPILFPSTLACAARRLGVTLPTGAIMMNRLHGGEAMATALDQIRQQHPTALVCGNRYQESALMAFYLPDHPRTFSLNINARPNQYDFWEAPERHLGKDFILVRLVHDAPPAAITALFRSWEALPPGTVMHYGIPSKEYRFFLMRGFLGRPHRIHGAEKSINPFAEAARL